MGHFARNNRSIVKTRFTITCSLFKNFYPKKKRGDLNKFERKLIVSLKSVIIRCTIRLYVAFADVDALNY